MLGCARMPVTAFTPRLPRGGPHPSRGERDQAPRESDAAHLTYEYNGQLCQEGLQTDDGALHLRSWLDRRSTWNRTSRTTSAQRVARLRMLGHPAERQAIPRLQKEPREKLTKPDNLLTSCPLAHSPGMRSRARAAVTSNRVWTGGVQPNSAGPAGRFGEVPVPVVVRRVTCNRPFPAPEANHHAAAPPAMPTPLTRRANDATPDRSGVPQEATKLDHVNEVPHERARTVLPAAEGPYKAGGRWLHGAATVWHARAIRSGAVPDRLAFSLSGNNMSVRSLSAYPLPDQPPPLIPMKAPVQAGAFFGLIG